MQQVFGPDSYQEKVYNQAIVPIVQEVCSNNVPLTLTARRGIWQALTATAFAMSAGGLRSLLGAA